jgi:hypothetical protein
MLEALKLARSKGKTQTLYAIAKDKRIPYQTMLDYLQNGRTDIPNLGRPRTVAPTDEHKLVEWMDVRAAALAPVTKEIATAKLRQIVSRRNLQQGTDKLFDTPTGDPSPGCWRRFRDEHPHVHYAFPSRHSAAALRAMNDPGTYTRFFDKIRPDLESIPIARRWTADEAAFVPHRSKRRKCFFVTGSRRCHALEVDGIRSNINLTNTVCGNGDRLATTVLLGGKDEMLEMQQRGTDVVSMGYTRESIILPLSEFSLSV